MSQHLIGRLTDFPDPSVRVVEVDGREVGVFRFRDRLYAYRNVCPHQGGPVCEGILLGKVEAVVAADQTVHGHRFSDDELHIVCPWHGYEYDVTTGACAADRKVRLRSYPVRLEGNEIWLEL
jgi:nitrite reductase/ring-hydroxylating ferredoxin subunit